MLNLLKSLFGSKDMTAMKNAIANGAIILDVRTAQEYAQGNISGSKNISIDKLEANIGKIKSWNKPIVVCCASGMRSARAKSILINKGLAEVYDAGGWTNLLS